MSEVIQKITEIHAPFNMVVLIVLFCSIAGVFTAIAKEIRKFACHRQELEFKRQMVEQGMSSQEIDHLLRSQSHAIAD